jgi:hypothetical protein
MAPAMPKTVRGRDLITRKAPSSKSDRVIGRSGTGSSGTALGAVVPGSGLSPARARDGDGPAGSDGLSGRAQPASGAGPPCGSTADRLSP